MPVRLEIGPRDIENKEVVLVRRDTQEKITVKMEKLKEELSIILEKIQENMYEEASKRLKNKTSIATTFEEFEKILNTNQGFIKAMWCGNSECEEKIKEKTAAKSRCIPFIEEKISDKCVCCGKPAKHMVIWGRQY